MRLVLCTSLPALAADSAHAQLPLGDPILVNSASQAGDQQLPAVGMADDGRVRVVWSDRTASDVRLRNFAADGSPFSETDLFQVDESEADAQISVNGSGDWFASWDTNAAADAGRDLYGRRSSINGSVLLNEFQVNAVDAVDITLPSRLSRADDDSYVAVWRDDTSPGELYFRKFAADGSPLTGDLIANQTNDPDLDSFDIAAAPDGGFMIVWQDQEGTTSGDDDIYLQRFRRRVVFTDDFESADLAYWSATAP